MTNTPKINERKTEPRAEIDELEKIMSEIDELQNELAVSGNPPIAASVGSDGSHEMNSDEILKEIQTSGLVDGSNMEETLAELKSEMTSASLLDDPSSEEDREREMAEKSMSNTDGSSGPNSGNGGALSMTLTGNMILNLKYGFEGQEVTISFNDQSFRVQMADGTEFKVPVSRKSQASNVKPFKKTA